MGELARLAAEPSEHQRKCWWEFIAIKDEPVLMDSGALVWAGWCPLCDDVHDDERLTARFDFRRGLLYCESNDGKSCHGRRSMSLTNVMIEMRQQGG